MRFEQSYEFGQSTLTIRLGNLRDARTDVIVTSDDQQLSMGGRGVAATIHEAAGDAVLAARERVPVPLGGVVSSGAGKLASQGVKQIFHAATIPSAGNRGVEDPGGVIASATKQAIAMLQAMGLKSIAFPALGTGHARFDPTAVALAMCEEIRTALLASQTPLAVEIWLLFGNKRDDEAVAYLSSFTARAQLQANAVRSHCVLLLHGIRTAAGWRESIGNELEQADPNLTPIPVGYEFFDVLRFLAPVGPWRRAAAETVWQKMKNVYDNPNIARVSIIAHSFGTWIVGYLLAKHDVKFHRVILCGSVLDTRYDWGGVEQKIRAPAFANAPTVKVVNDCGTKDIWPVFAKFATWGYGVGGRWGFQHALVRDRFHVVDHSGFFTTGFATKHWVPVLTGKLTKGIDEGAQINPPGWVNLLTLVKLPYLAVAAVGVAAWFLA
jgi:O-acetyl-ADP-ribose deacetylase (regulator of RNase III)/pimeloyl-ACP methyl ester carboxylesterase